MEVLLVSAAIVSLLLAAVMSVVAWKLLRQHRDRSAVRVATLETLAFSDDPRTDEIRDTREADFADAADNDWDLALHADEAEEPVHRKPAYRAYRKPAHREPVHVEPPQPRRRPRAVAAVPVHDGMFIATATPAAPRRRWVAVAAVVLVAAAGYASAFGLGGAEGLSSLSLPSGLMRVSHDASATPLELLSLRHDSGGGDSFTVTGLVQNPMAGRPVGDVAAVIYLFDRQGRYFATGRATLEPASLQPGEESPFVVSIANASDVGRYRVGFRFVDGGVVAHVDRRGHEPDSTTNGALDSPSQAVVPVAIPRGTEGD